jgi:hypothetical protein
MTSEDFLTAPAGVAHKSLDVCWRGASLSPRGSRGATIVLLQHRTLRHEPNSRSAIFKACRYRPTTSCTPFTYEQWPGNRPAGNAEIQIETADGSSLELAKAGDGMFIARFNRTGHLRDALMVMQSADRTAEQPTEIAYDDLTDAHSTVGHQQPIALASGGIGAAITGLALLGIRHWQRNVLGGSPGTKTG